MSLELPRGWLVAGATMAAGAAVIYLLKRQRRSLVRRCGAIGSLEGKLALVTGASSGLGKRLALELALRGAAVILAGRDRTAVEAATAEVKAALVAAKTPQYSLSQAIFNLTSLASVREFARKFRARYERLDILVCNAGIMGAPFGLTENGVESHFQANYLGHFLLSQELLPCLMAAKGRAVNVSSGFYRNPKAIDWSYLEVTPPPGYGKTLDPYAHSKLAQVLHSVELARRAPSVTAVSCSPGFVGGTKLGRHHSRVLRCMAAPLIWFLSRSVEEGVQCLLHCAAAEGIVSGAFYSNCEKQPSSELVTEEAAEELWHLSESLVEEALEGRRYKTVKGDIVKKRKD